VVIVRIHTAPRAVGPVVSRIPYRVFCVVASRVGRGRGRGRGRESGSGRGRGSYTPCPFSRSAASAHRRGQPRPPANHPRPPRRRGRLRVLQRGGWRLQHPLRTSWVCPVERLGVAAAAVGVKVGEPALPARFLRRPVCIVGLSTVAGAVAKPARVCRSLRPPRGQIFCLIEQSRVPSGIRGRNLRNRAVAPCRQPFPARLGASSKAEGQQKGRQPRECRRRHGCWQCF